jgi:3-methyladenine DNA glycosylase AlkC
VIHRLCIEHGVESLLDHIRPWFSDPDPRLRALALMGLRPRLPLVPHIDELKRSPGWLRALLESYTTETDKEVEAILIACLDDIARDNPVVLMEWAEAWMRQDTANFWKPRLEQGLAYLLEQGNPRAMALLGYQRLEGITVQFMSEIPEQLQKNKVIPLELELQGKKISSELAIRVHAVLQFSDGENSEKLELAVVHLGVGTLSPQGSMRVKGGIHFVDTLKQSKERGAYNLQIRINGWPVLDKPLVYRKMKNT